METYTLQFNVIPSKNECDESGDYRFFPILLQYARLLINPWRIIRDSDGVVLVEHEMSQVHD